MKTTFGYRISVNDGNVCAKVFIKEDDVIVSRAAIKFFSSPFDSLEKRLKKAHAWVDKTINVLEDNLEKK